MSNDYGSCQDFISIPRKEFHTIQRRLADTRRQRRWAETELQQAQDELANLKRDVARAVYKSLEICGRLLLVSNYGDIMQLKNGAYSAVTLHKHSLGYAKITLPTSVGPKTFLAHRLVAQAHLSDFDKNLQVDHINGIKDDNRVDNLRMVTNAGNHRAKIPIKNRFRGVSWNRKKKKWVASIQKNGVSYSGGFYDSEIDAARAYNGLVDEHGFYQEAKNIITPDLFDEGGAK